jgi:hypothetical protein
MWLTRARPYDCWGCLICWLLLLLPKLLLLRIGMRLAPDTSGLGPFTELEKVVVVGFLAYRQLVMKCPVSRQLKHIRELLLLLAVIWLVLFCGGFMALWLL